MLYIQPLTIHTVSEPVLVLGDVMIFNDDTSDLPGLSSYTVFIMMSSTYISNLDTFEYSKTIKRFKYWLFFLIKCPFFTLLDVTFRYLLFCL